MATDLVDVPFDLIAHARLLREESAALRATARAAVERARAIVRLSCRLSDDLLIAHKRSHELVKRPASRT